MKYAFLSFALLLLLLGCIAPNPPQPNQNMPENTGQKMVADSPLQGYKTYNNDAEGISFQFPASWKIRENKDALLFLESADGRAQLAVLVFDLSPTAYENLAEEKYQNDLASQKAFNVEKEPTLAGGQLAMRVISDSGPQGKNSELKDTVTTASTYVSDKLNGRVIEVIFSTYSGDYEKYAPEEEHLFQTFVHSKAK